MKNIIIFGAPGSGKGTQSDLLVERLVLRGKTSGRADDNEQTIKARLEVYHNQTAPLAEWYKKRNLLRTVNGVGSIEDINAQLCKAIDAI